MCRQIGCGKAIACTDLGSRRRRLGRSSDVVRYTATSTPEWQSRDLRSYQSRSVVTIPQDSLSLSPFISEKQSSEPPPQLMWTPGNCESSSSVPMSTASPSTTYPNLLQLGSTKLRIIHNLLRNIPQRRSKRLATFIKRQSLIRMFNICAMKSAPSPPRSTAKDSRSVSFTL